MEILSDKAVSLIIGKNASHLSYVKSHNSKQYKVYRLGAYLASKGLSEEDVEELVTLRDSIKNVRSQ